MRRNYDRYKVKAFLDTNIVLEGRALEDLPWHEIDATGPILALLTPKAMDEIDSKKHDGRLGKRAREFNRRIGTVAAGGEPLVIREGAPRVDLALATASLIPWDQHDGLDPTDGDSRIVAEALHARDMNGDGKVVVSHDIKSIRLAHDCGLATHHASDDWLRAPEPSPHDKELQRLRGRVAEYEAKEPAFEILIKLPDGEPVSIVHIDDLTAAERSSIERKIIELNPQKDQTRNPLDMSNLHRQDYGYADRYRKYLKRVPLFMEDYAHRVERTFNQTPCTISITNTGKMQAENLLIEVRASSGWLHSRYAFIAPQGPKAPHPQMTMFNMPHLAPQRFPQPVGRHEFAFKDRPRWNPYFSLTCEDFRHDQTWERTVVLGFDPREEDARIIVSISASNFRGKAELVKTIEREVHARHLSELVDLNTMKITAPTPIDDLIKRRETEDWIDLKAFSIDEDDE